jgi:hypothetical protein
MDDSWRAFLFLCDLCGLAGGGLVLNERAVTELLRIGRNLTHFLVAIVIFMI